jgi:GGDEF domain-containing protein
LRELLEACLDLDILAEEVYRRFANDTGDHSLSALFSLLRADKEQHAVWWTDTFRAGINNENVCVDADPHVVTYLRAVVETVRCTLETRFEGFTDEDRLAVAASLEYFGLDPVFGELIDVTDPDGLLGRRAAYDDHIERLVRAMESQRAWALVSQVALLRVASARPLGGTRMRDDRTGLPSGDAAAAVLTELCSRETRGDEFVSLALLDVGEPLGCLTPANGSLDDVLSLTTSVIQNHLGPGDLLFRDARGRFGAVMPAASADEAGKAAEALVEALKERLHDGDGKRASGARVRAAVLTVSPGVSPRIDARALLADASGMLERMRSDEAGGVGILNLS